MELINKWKLINIIVSKIIATLFLCFILFTNSVHAIIKTPQENIDSLKIALKSIKDENDTLKPTIYIKIANNYKGINTDSLKYFADLALKYSETQNFQNGIGEALRIYSIYNFYNNNFETSISQLEEALEIFKKSKNNLGLSIVEYNLGIVFRAIGQIDEALNKFEKSFEIAHKYGFKKQIGLALIAKASIYTRLGRTDEALKLLEEATEILIKLDSKRDLGSTYSNIGIVYERNGNFRKALTYHEKALKIFEEIKIDEQIVNATINIANNSQRLGNHLYAIKILKDILPVVKLKKLTRNESLIYNTLANTYLSMHDNEKSLKYYLKSREIIKDIDLVTYAALSVNIAIIEQENKKYNDAFENLSIALDIYRQLKMENETGIALSAIGYNYLKLKDFENAEKYFLESLSINPNNKYKLNASNTYLGIATLYFEKSELKLAEENAIIAYNLSKELNAKENIADAAETLYEVYKKKNNTSKALLYHEEYVLLKDSLFNEDKSKELGRLEAEYEYKILAEKKELENQNKLLEKEIQISKQRYFTIILSIGFIILIILSAVLYYLKNMREKTNKILLQNQEKIKQSNEELEELHLQKNKLFSIIAHDLRGPINTVGALIDMALSNNISDAELKSFLPEINKEITNTRILTENLLNWAGKSMEEYSKNKEVISLFEAVEDKRNLFLSNLRKKKINFINEVDKNSQIYIDQNALELVLRNLISNAIKFCNDNDSITITCSNDENYTKVCVTDTGIGMEKNKADKLFTDKSVESTSGTSEEKGSGIGLMLCKNFIAENGGKIWVESSEIGKGTKICFTVPFK